MTTVLAESFQLGSLPPSLNEAIITLISIKGKDPTECASYRPISLLNTDAKILAKVLARRLEGVIPLIISSDQTGFIKNRYSFFNVRRLFNIIYSPTGNVPECVVALDAEKAFDRVEWRYLFTVLEKFGFGSSFISLVNLLYASPTAAVQTNGTLSQPFALGRGTCQGCTLSPILFNLAIEPLAIALRNSADVAGISRGGSVHEVSLYADDLLLYISNPTTSLPAALSLLEQFGSISGYKLNLNKSTLFPINSEALHLDYKDSPFKLERQQFIYLGVTVTRINSIKMTILPKFTYLFQMVPVFIPKSFFVSLDSVFSSYIWQNKKPRVNKLLLQRLKRDGGMGLPNTRHYYWAANIRCLTFWRHFYLQPNRPAWTSLELRSCGDVSLPALLGSPLSQFSSKLIANPVVRHTLKV